MPTIKELEFAMMRAHSAGDAQAAAIMAKEIEAQMATEANRAKAFKETKRELLGGPISSAITGGLDTAGGIAGLVSRGAELAGLPKGTDLPFIASPEIVQQRTKEAKEAVERKFGAPKNEVIRAVTGGALTIPFTPVRAAVTAPTLAARAGAGGISGAISGALQDVPEASSAADFWKQKATQTGAGGLAGFLTTPVAEWGVKAVSSAINKGANKAATIVRGAVGTDDLIRLTRDSLRKSNVDFDALNESAKQALLRDVEAALKANPALNEGAVARQAAFRQEGFDPLQHWVTKDPGQWTVNENVAGVRGVGEPLMERKAALDEFIISRLNDLRGGAKTDASSVGQLASRDLDAWMKGQRARTNVLYDTARDIAPRDIPGDPQRVANGLFGTLESQGMMGALPPQFHKWANEISSGKMPLNFQTIDELIKAANAAYGSDAATNKALGHFKRVLGDELTEISKAAIPRGGEARFTADALELARKQAASVKGAIESTPALKAYADGTLEPEQFFRRFISGGEVSVREVANTWAKLSSETKEAVRQKMVDHLKTIAFGGASDASGKPAAQASFNKWITGDGVDKKLQIILGPKGFEQVKRLGLMMEAAHLAPSGNKANTSNTGAAVVSSLMRGADAWKELGLPGATALQRVAGAGQAEMALGNDPLQLGRRIQAISPEMQEFLRRYGGGLLAPLGGAAAGGLLAGN